MSLEAAATTLRAKIKDLQAQLAKAPARQRAAIASQIQDLQSELDLNQARLDALKALTEFESGSAAPDQNSGLTAQIDELERSIADSSKKTTTLPVDTALVTRSERTGILSFITDLFALSNKLDALEENIALAKALAARADGVRKSILASITSLNERGDALARGAGGADVAALQDRKKSFEKLLETHKLASAAALPLSKQIVLLGVYVNNVQRWHDAVEQRWNKEFRSLIIRLIVLGASLLLIFLGSLVWRWLTNRYVTDIRRRGQVMAARRLVLGLLIVIVLMVNFSDELGSAATVVGFAAAGIAVALQNVILSIAGYFFLIGRFGIKAGDRVQIGGVTGDVIDIGLVKLSLMELGGTGTHREPTGRVVVFSNAIVFQPSGNFFKQAPGTSFVWNEVRLTLAPDVDYRLAEKRILDAVDEVFARYRDRVMRDYRHLERDLNVMLETPKPQSRLHLSQTGLEIIIRYPAETYTRAANHRRNFAPGARRDQPRAKLAAGGRRVSRISSRKFRRPQARTMAPRRPATAMGKRPTEINRGGGERRWQRRRQVEDYLTPNRRSHRREGEPDSEIRSRRRNAMLRGGVPAMLSTMSASSGIR